MAAEIRIGEFYDYEIEQRRLLDFPPFSRLFRVVFRGKDEKKVFRIADQLASSLANRGKHWKLMGPAECPIGRISGQYRRHIILQSSGFDHTHAALGEALNRIPPVHGIRIEVDIDPVSLL